jgi:hypothetical protein
MARPGLCDTDRPDLIPVSDNSAHAAACVRLGDVTTEMPLSPALVSATGEEGNTAGGSA